MWQQQWQVMARYTISAAALGCLGKWECVAGRGRGRAFTLSPPHLSLLPLIQIWVRGEDFSRHTSLQARWRSESCEMWEQNDCLKSFCRCIKVQILYYYIRVWFCVVRGNVRAMWRGFVRGFFSCFVFLKKHWFLQHTALIACPLGF